MLAEKQTSGLDAYLRLLKYLGPHWLQFSIATFGFFLFAASQPALAELMKYLVEAIQNRDNANDRFLIPAWLPALLPRP
ncbi:MAG: hypothetical protein P8Y45_07975 [Exilibacterium sp.]